MVVKLSLTHHYHFILICAVSRREGDDAIATMSLKRRFIVSEKGRMINIICIIIFFILSHLSPSPQPRQGVGQGGPSSGQPFLPGRSAGRRLGTSRWRVAGPPPGYPASTGPPRTGRGFSLWDLSRPPAPPRGRQQPLGAACPSAPAPAPPWEGKVTKVTGII